MASAEWKIKTSIPLAHLADEVGLCGSALKLYKPLMISHKEIDHSMKEKGNTFPFALEICLTSAREGDASWSINAKLINSKVVIHLP